MALVGCSNGSDDSPSALSGTYKVTKVENSFATVTKSGTTLTFTSSEGTVTVTKNGDTYTSNPEDFSEAQERYDEYIECFDWTFTLNNGTWTILMSGDTFTGTYTVSGNEGTVTYEEGSSTITTSDNWQNFVMVQDGDKVTYTKQ